LRARLTAAIMAARAAIASGDSEKMEHAENALRVALDELRREPRLPDEGCSDVLESCGRLDVVLRAASKFYLGLTAAMKVQLQGYGHSGDQPQPGRRFAVKG
jgi:hypothetical protein